MEPSPRDLVEPSGTEKGDTGKVGVVAGSVDHTGPPAVVGTAALRAGSDLVKVVTSEEVMPVVAGYSPNLVVGGYIGDHLSSDSVSKVGEVEAWSDALVVGPGLSAPDADAVSEVVAAASVPLVVDADAVAPAMDADFEEAVFTPDAAEAATIADEYGSVEAFAERTGAVVVSTGAEDVVVDADGRWTNETGTAAMTVGGTGDALAGTVASLLGRGLDPRDAARLGTRIVGTAGELAAGDYGNGMLATDLVERIPEAMGA